MAFYRSAFGVNGITPADYNNVLAQLIEETASGSIVSFADGANQIPVKSLIVDINPVQSGTGDPSPDNVRPITPRTSATVTHLGKNLADFLDNLATTSSGLTISRTADNGVHVSGTATNTWAILTSEIDLDLKSGTTITFSIGNTISHRVYVRIRYSDNTTQSVTIDSGTNTTVTLSKDMIKVRLDYSGLSTGASYDETFYPMIEIGSTATAYEPYVSPSTDTKTFNACYGGKLNLATGALEFTHRFLDPTTLTWSYSSGATYPRFVSSAISDIKPTSNNDEVTTAISNKYASASINEGYSGRKTDCFAVGSTKNIWVWDTDYTNLNDFINSLSSVQFVIPLADPYIVLLTKEEIKTLLGGNTFYADTGDVTVTYRANGQLYIEQH